MALNRHSILDRELHKFVESPTRPGEPAVEIAGSFSATVDPGPFSPPSATDAFTRSVSGNTETIEYRSGGLSGTILKTIKVYYQTPPDPDLTGGELL